MPFKWDDLDTKLIQLIIKQYHRNAIISESGESKEKVRARLRRLIKHGIILPSKGDHTLGVACITYIITQPFAQILIHNEGLEDGAVIPEERPLKYEYHATSFRAEILDRKAPRPKGDSQFKMNHWTGEIFHYPDYTIRLTPKFAIIDLNQILAADSDTNLLLKYHNLAISALGKFSEQHKLPLGQVESNREPHRPIYGSHGLAQALIDKGGELDFLDLGIGVDSSDPDNKGEVEPKTRKAALILEGALNHFPNIVAAVRSDNQQTRQEVKQIHKEVNQIREEVKQTNHAAPGNQLMQEIHPSILAEKFKPDLDNQPKSKTAIPQLPCLNSKIPLKDCTNIRCAEFSRCTGGAAL